MLLSLAIGALVVLLALVVIVALCACIVAARADANRPDLPK